MIESAITSKGRTTLPKAVREALGVSSGDRLRYVIMDNGNVRLLPVQRLSELFGMLAYDGPPVTLEDMDRAVAEGACDN